MNNCEEERGRQIFESRSAADLFENHLSMKCSGNERDRQARILTKTRWTKTIRYGGPNSKHLHSMIGQGGHGMGVNPRVGRSIDRDWKTE